MGRSPNLLIKEREKKCISKKQVLYELGYKISEATNQTVFLNILEKEDAICVKISESHRNHLRLYIKVGSRLPLHTGSRGKVRLVFLPGNNKRKIIESCGKYINDKLEVIKGSGWSASKGERFPGVVGVSIPLFQDDVIVSSITIASPKDVSNEDIQNGWVNILKKYKRTMEKLIKIRTKIYGECDIGI